MAKKNTNVAMIALKLLDCLKETPNIVVTYPTIRKKLYPLFFNNFKPDAINRRIRDAYEILKECKYNVEKVDTNPKGFIYKTNLGEEKLNKMTIYSFSKLGFFAKNNDFIIPFTIKSYSQYSKYFIYTNDLVSFNKNEISNIPKIIEAIQSNKYLQFSRSDSISYNNKNNTNDILYKPLCLLVDNDKSGFIYLATVFQIAEKKHYVLDFIPIHSIHNIEISNEKYTKTLKRILKKTYPYSFNINNNYTSQTQLEPIIDKFITNDYTKHSCEIQFYNDRFINELIEKFIYIYFEESISIPFKKYYSYIYYDDENILFDWIYNKRKIKDIFINKYECKKFIKKNIKKIDTSISNIKEHNKQIKLFLSLNSMSLNIPNYNLRSRYTSYEIKRINEKIK